MDEVAACFGGGLIIGSKLLSLLNSPVESASCDSFKCAACGGLVGGVVLVFEASTPGNVVSEAALVSRGDAFG